MGASARLHAERRFSVQMFASRVQDVYESLRPAGGRPVESYTSRGTRAAL
jgi:hypothetical protein